MELFNGLDIDKESWYEVLSASLGQVLAAQTACAEKIVKNKEWELDLKTGTIKFGEDEFPVQLIGSESKESNTWLWGWENVNNIDEEFLTLANDMKIKGEEWELVGLTTPEFDIDDMYNGHTASVVTCALSENNICYYRCVHENGAIFVAFSNVSEEVFAPVGIEKFVNITIQAIKQVDIDHRIFIKSFLKWNKTLFEEFEDGITAHFPENLFISFEQTEDGERISNIRT